MQLSFFLFCKRKLALKCLFVLTAVIISFYQIQQIISNLATALNGAPTITGISPNTGSTAGGQTATITGTNFMSNEVMFEQVAAGDGHSLAIDVNGNLWTWGSNTFGQLGNNSTTNAPVPINLSALAGNPVQNLNFQTASVGSSHSLAIDTAGNLWTWGRNDVGGQLGNNSATDSSVPINLSALAGSPVQNIQFRTVTAGSGALHSLAIDVNGNLWTWGSNTFGQLGNNSTTDSPVPINLSTLAGSPVQNFRFLTATANYDHSLAIDVNGNLWTWGSNANGQLGNNSTTNSPVPINLSALAGSPVQNLHLQAIAASASHSMAIDTNGNLWTWGAGSFGQLGNGTTTDSSVPINLSTLAGSPVQNLRFQTIAGGFNHSLAIDVDGNLWIWGSNLEGQLGNNSTTNSPVPINLSALAGSPVQNLRFQTIAGGGGVFDLLSHSLAIDTSGKSWAWGSNGSSQLGNGGTSGQSLIPIRPLATTTPYSVVTGVKFGRFNANFTVNSDTSITVTVPQSNIGTVDVVVQSPRGFFTFPNAYTYIFPDPTITNVSPNSGSTDGGEAVAITGTNFMAEQEIEYAQVSASSHSLAIDTNGDLWVWGRNIYGQLGNNSATDSSVPINLSALVGSPVQNLRFRTIAAGVDHSLAIDTSGDLWAWGRNSVGQLGNNSTTNSPVPINLSALAGSPVQNLKFQTIAAGGHSLAIDTSGNLWAWGSNYAGQLGNNSTTNSSVPINLSALVGSPVQNLNFQTASVGSSHSLAIDASGNLWAWGANYYGQLGNNSTTNSTVPINLSTLAGNPAQNVQFESIAANGHSLAIDTANNLWAWGYNNYGQLGNNSTTNSTVPINLSTLAGSPIQNVKFQTLAAGYGHSLAIDDSNNLWAWGANHSGQLGNNSTTDSPVPINLSTLAGSPLQNLQFNFVAAYNHSLAIDASGSLWSWGSNFFGQLGDGNNTTSQSSAPTNLSALANTSSVYGVNFRTVSAGYEYSLAIDTAGNLWSWGANDYGQLGNNSTANSYAPINLSALAGSPVQNLRFQSVSADNHHSLAIDVNGNLWVWGANYYGQLGNNSYNDSSVPINLSALAGSPVQNLRFQAIAAGYDHSLAIDTNGNLWSWGSNSYGQLGDNSYNDSLVPINLSTLGGSSVQNIQFNSIAAYYHSLAIDVNGNLWTWGSNANGQLGNNSYTESVVPINLSILAGNPVQNVQFNSVAASDHSLAIDVNGNLWAWGANYYGQLGNNSTTDSLVPINLSALAGNPVQNLRFQSISTGYYSSIAIDASDSLWIWGSNDYGQLGNNSTTDSLVPINLSALAGSPVQNVQFQAGSINLHSLAIDVNGNLWSWGWNGFGQLGTGCIDTNWCTLPALTTAAWAYIPVIDLLTFGGTNALDFTVSSPVSMTATTPPHNAGLVDVSAVNASGGIGTLTNGYNYILNLFINMTLDIYDLEINATPTPAGVVSSKKQTLSFQTNSPSGAKVSISTTTASNNMSKTADSTKNITAVAGSIASPVVLAYDTWGFAVANANTNVTNGFDVSYSPELNNPNSTSRWAAVPNNTSPLTIESTNAPNPTVPNNTEIYFGTRATTNLPVGLYRTAIVYTVVENL